MVVTERKCSENILITESPLTLSNSSETGGGSVVFVTGLLKFYVTVTSVW
jgi:hypothetical protein